MITLWSDDEIAYVKQLLIEGLSMSRMAAAVNAKFHTGRTRNGVIGILHRSGLTSVRDHKETNRLKGVMAAKRSDGALRKRREAKPKIAPNADPAMVAILTATDDKPSETSQPILVMRDGKLHANDALSENSCRWPIGDPLARDFCFCGQDTIPLQSYCKDHFLRVYETVKVRQPVPANDEKVKVSA